MKQDYKYYNPENQEELFKRVEAPFGKSKEESWADLETRLAEKPAGKVLHFRKRSLIYAVAATILLLAGAFSLMRFYTNTVICPAGEHLAYQLPDGSAVQLNADSKITYHPYWWNFSREVRFDGEGFFQVEKGSEFSVISGAGTTEVLGTSFNIFAREGEYKVTCLSGQVKVTSFAKAEVVLSPDYSAQVSSTGEIIMTKEVNAHDTYAWIDNMFRFTSKPLGQVFQEIARQYNVRITLRSPIELTYTGFFSKNRPLEETLTLVCTPFGLNFAKISEKEYVISQN